MLNNLRCPYCDEPFAPCEVQDGIIAHKECIELEQEHKKMLRDRLLDVDVALSLGEQPDREQIKKTLEDVK